MYAKRPGDATYKLPYSDGTSTSFISWVPIEDINLSTLTASVSHPTVFSIRDIQTPTTRLSSTTTSAGAISNGECTLTDSTGAFTTTVSPGDEVHNVTDGSDGIVLSVTSATAVVTSLFGGTDNDWTSGDSYVIQPQTRRQLVLHQPPSTGSHTVTVSYIQRPRPVFSIYGIYRIDAAFHHALTYYAAWLYKYRDRQPDMGDRLYQHWDRQVRMGMAGSNATLVRSGVPVYRKSRMY